MADLIQIRRDKGSVWQSVNPTLALAEIGIVLDDNGAMTNPIQFKVGNGSTAWNNLPMQNGSAINKIKVNGVELTIDGNRAVDVIVKASGSLGTDVSGSTVAFVDSTGVVRNSSINVANTSGSSTSSLITQAAVSESIADVRKDIDFLSGSVSGSFAAVDERVTGIEENIENNYAKIDGSYDSMAVGVAKNLEGDQEVEDTFISRTAGGTAEIANGVAQILEVKGNSMVWNQLVSIHSKVGDGEIEQLNFTKGHKYLVFWKQDVDIPSSTRNTLRIDFLYFQRSVGNNHPNAGYYNWMFTFEEDSGMHYLAWWIVDYPEGVTPSISNIVCYDLTQMFGAGNEPSTVEEFEAWLAENIGPLEYYPYNAGTVLNNSMEGIETTGFNLLDPATGKAQILGAYDDASGNFYGITGTHGTITFKAADGTEETITPDADGKFQLTVPGELTVANAGADCAVFLWWDGSKTDYEEYDKNVSYLDVKNIYGKLNGSGNLVQVFPDGMAGVNNVKDVLHIENDKPAARKKIGRRAYLSGDESNTSVVSDGSTYTYYKLDTEQVYTDLVYINSSHFADNTPVALPVTYTVNNHGIENILPKNTSENVSTAPADLLCRYAMDAVAQLNAHSNQIEDLYEVKADKEGTYPGLVAGNLVDTSGVGTEQQFVFRHTGGEEHVADKTQAVIQKYIGKSLVWNQLITNGDFSSSLDGWAALFGSNTLVDGMLEFTADSSNNNGKGVSSEKYIKTVIGHKYLIAYDAKATTPVNIVLCPGMSSGTSLWLQSDTITANKSRQRFLWTNLDITNLQLGFRWLSNNVSQKLYIDNVILTDLTQMFGAGNEPSTVEEFEAMFPQPYCEYNEGTIISNNVDSIETVGFNQWDEEWENGRYNAITGKPYDGAAGIRAKNPIRVSAGQTYYFKNGIPNLAIIVFLDSKKKATGNYIENVRNATFTIPRGCSYILWYISLDTNAPYNHDICINISDPAKNGTYEPYEKHSIQIGLGEFQVKDSEGSVITVNGLKSAGSVYDEIDPVRKKYIKRVGVRVFDGTENWIFIASIEGRLTNVCFLQMGDDFGALSKGDVVNMICSNYEQLVGYSSEGSLLSYFNTIGYNAEKQLTIKDSAYTTSVETWKSHLAELYAAGTPLVVYYELATPEEYDLVKNIPETYPAFGVGTEAIKPSGVNEETGVPETTPFRAVIFYSKDYLSQLNNMPRDYISVGSMTNFYTELASKLGAAISKSISVSASFNSSDQKYDYMITISDISGSI